MKSNKGFLLLEVIVSVLLVAGGLTIASYSFSVSKKMLLESRDIFSSALLLREKSFEFEEKGRIEAMTRRGESGPGAWRWESQGTPVEKTDLIKLHLRVYRQGVRDSDQTVETFLRKASS